MPNQNSKYLEITLSKKDLHELWVKTYYSGRNLKFYDLAFKRIFKIVKANSIDNFLDAGCGNGVHSLRLAKLGFNVTSIDFSEEALKLAKNKIFENGFSDNITLKKDNLLSLSFSNSEFDNILCWGVLMHIPDIETALLELARVLKKDGYLILSENNKNSVQTFFAKLYKKTKNNELIIKDKSGVCFWSETKSGRFLVRKTNINWLVHYLNLNGLKLVKKFPGQFTSLYTRSNNGFVKNIFYIFNEIWFRVLRISFLSEGNILIFIKEKGN